MLPGRFPSSEDALKRPSKQGELCYQPLPVPLHDTQPGTTNNRHPLPYTSPCYQRPAAPEQGAPSEWSRARHAEGPTTLATLPSCQVASPTASIRLVRPRHLHRIRQRC